jgi:hypothetical protein
VLAVGDNPNEIALDMDFHLNWYIYETGNGTPVTGVPNAYHGVYTLRHEQKGEQRTLYVKAGSDADPLFGIKELKMERILKTLENGGRMTDSHEVVDAQFTELLKDVFYKLPESVMPGYLKTETQRLEAELSAGEKDNSNYLEVNQYSKTSNDEDFEWRMAGYPIEDSRNVVLIVQYCSLIDHRVTVVSDKTLNYNIETGALTEIERPIDPYTADEMIDESHFDSPGLGAKAKAYFNRNKQPVGYQEFNKYGFKVYAMLHGYEGTSYVGNGNRVTSSRLWDGSRFVRGVRWYETREREVVMYIDD